MHDIPASLFVANTDRPWFDFLTARAVGGVVDEVNFWLPKAQRAMVRMSPGEPLLFRLKKPTHAIVGFGFFAHFELLDLDLAWTTFGWKNGDADRIRFLERIGGYRKLDLLDPRVERGPLGCTVLRDAHFWPPSRWIPWDARERWPTNVQQGMTVRDASQVARLLAAMRRDVQSEPDDLVSAFTLLDADERSLRAAEVAVREGQGAFKLRLLSAYDRQCAITGEHTVPVLDAAHIQSYLGARSNHVQNGILLTKEFHALYDAGYVGITPDFQVTVSERLRTEFKNGRRYYPYNDQRLAHLPADPAARPSRDALAWHHERKFLGTG